MTHITSGIQRRADLGHTLSLVVACLEDEGWVFAGIRMWVFLSWYVGPSVSGVLGLSCWVFIVGDDGAFPLQCVGKFGASNPEQTHGSGSVP